jgi:hypothetical protein
MSRVLQDFVAQRPKIDKTAVLKKNPARHLYGALGFAVIGEAGVKLAMDEVRHSDNSSAWVAAGARPQLGHSVGGAPGDDRFALVADVPRATRLTRNGPRYGVCLVNGTDIAMVSRQPSAAGTCVQATATIWLDFVLRRDVFCYVFWIEH